MSSTELYVITNEKNVNCTEFKNAFRGAMYVWNDIAKRYAGYDYFPHSNEDDQMEVWNYYARHPGIMKDHEIIVLASTMDGAVIESNRWKELVNAFEKYGEEHPNSNYAEQAKDISGLVQLIGEDNIMYFAWNQTTVCDFWGMEYIEETDEYEVYDPNEGSRHFWVFEHIENTDDEEEYEDE